MSSEEILSVGIGVGVQELSSSRSSEVESSRSKGSERVGGEMEEVGVPSNVLEVDDDRAKYYNEEEEVVSEFRRWWGMRVHGGAEVSNARAVSSVAGGVRAGNNTTRPKRCLADPRIPSLLPNMRCCTYSQHL
ncbi:hypothetical protein SLEP1_g4875 [Rubroshorea leprosula]|uniref:Uncharacterized protein n=1 Tax=Rubroshorea leprosula TaxID=152421 RepID=A0AAV5HW18_9ROSI|nr:hypothetical protein SLEP1_g4875 [Rubroshorea leprosula]